MYYSLFNPLLLSLSIERIYVLCRVFAMKNVQNRKYFWRTSQDCFVLALFSSLYS
jgi:hypothetical protein